MTSDPVLHALALIELVARIDGADPLAEYATLTGVECEHEVVALYLADIVLRIAEKTGFELQPFIDAERTQALAIDEPPPAGGMA